MQYNISPETLVAQDKVKDMSVDKLLDKKVDTSSFKGVTMTPNGALFKTTKRGFLPEIMQSMYDDRVKYKKLMLQSKQEYENTKNLNYSKILQSIITSNLLKKISLNSAYGAIGNNWFRYYDLLVAEAITTSGQLSIRWIENAVNDYLNENCLRPIMKITLLHQIQTQYMLFLTNLLISVFKEEQDLQKIPFLDTIAREKIEPFIDKSYKDLHQYVNCV